jgi:hypothetical protein
MENKDLIKNDNKILFQINYDVEEDTYKYIVNEMTNQEFLAFLMFLRLCINQFGDKTFQECFKNDL